jgi:hypothetical protein
MDRLRHTVMLLAVIAVPTAAHTFLAPTEQGVCFATGTATLQVNAQAPTPDFRVRIDNATAQPDVRIVLVDRPEIADLVLADDWSGTERSACGTPLRVQTIRVDQQEPTPDITVRLTAKDSDSDLKLYVNSARFSHQDAAALLAVMWKTSRNRELAAAALDR